ncbi:MAG: biotin transporter BioY [Lachnospiraceae bacterium]|nr:biotin transporter BioY [Lachnospiraceae bacterium]
MAYIAVFAVLMAICSWISIPIVIPFTLQTFAVFLAVCVLGGKRGTLSVIIFVLLGAVGVPVFAGFSGGPHVIMGNTGGYIIGFIFAGLLMWLMERLFGRKIWVQAVSMLLGMVTYYVFGTIWFMIVYMRTTGPVGVSAVLGWCVIPFIIPDLVKAALALFLGTTLRKPLSAIMGEN